MSAAPEAVVVAAPEAVVVAAQEAVVVAATAVTDHLAPATAVSAEDPAVTASIWRRACAMERAGQYIGLWEILCWCGLHETQCRLPLAEGIVDVVDAFEIR